MKVLTRSRENKVFLGVLGGFAEYFEVDPALVRVFWILLTVFTGFVPGILSYFLMALVIPYSTPEQRKE